MIEILLGLIVAIFVYLRNAFVDGACTGGNHCLEVKFDEIAEYLNPDGPIRHFSL